MALDGKRVLVTGACGTVGQELTRQLLDSARLGELVAVDNNESALFFLEQRHRHQTGASFFLADVRDRDKMAVLMEGIDVVFHTAAFKHVMLCERSPFEAVQTNIVGVQNIIAAAMENKVERVIFTSSDKAVNPTSVMGTSKLMGERLMTAASSNIRAERPVFSSTRFGNVLGSRGSVIPVFYEQIRRGGPVTLTDPAMTRFIMSIRQAVSLLIASCELSCGGEVFVTKMPVIRIEDLASVMIEKLAPTFGFAPERIEIRIVGTSPGEKMYEELMNQEETRRALELKDYFVILPAFSPTCRHQPHHYPQVRSHIVTNPYHSGNEPALSRDALASFLEQNDLLGENPADTPPASRHPQNQCA